jgi:hypothetical protein
MANNPAPVVAHIGEGSLDLGGGNSVLLSNTPMPIVYFESAPSLSHNNGIVGVTLTVTGNVPTSDGKILQVASVVAHLKCNILAAIRGALDSALLLAQPVENPASKSN